LNRSKWGLLEKSKDYKLRAADHKEKRARLKTLREKAANRNPDEFAFGMMSAKSGKGGVRLGERGNEVLGHETAMLLKGQDAGYIRTVLDKTRKDRQRLEEAVMGGEGLRRKVVFVDSMNEQSVIRDKSKVEVEEAVGSEEEESEEENPKSKQQKTLEALRKRELELTKAERELDFQRAKMTNSIGGVNKKGVKYKIRERKR
jgi:U3 small nucleolar RNA-associated protein 11